MGTLSESRSESGRGFGGEFGGGVQSAHDAAIASAFFRFAQGFGGCVSHRVVADHHVGFGDDHADADRDADRFAVVDRLTVRDGRSHAFRQHERAFVPGLWCDDHEFLAADSPDRIDGSHRIRERLREPRQNVITAREQVLRIDVLEVVGIDQSQRQWSGYASATEQFISRKSVHTTTIRQSGECVGECHFLQHDVALLELTIRQFEFAGAFLNALFEFEIQSSQLFEQLFVRSFEQEIPRAFA